MNIFYLHKNPAVAAKMHCDKHVVKMILETAQLLCTAHHETGTGTKAMYKSTHKNHPIAKWVRESSSHYSWAYNLLIALLNEYHHRRGRSHKTVEQLPHLIYNPRNVPNKGFTPPPQCMPDEYKDKDTITAYRNYYKGDKVRIAEWNWGRPAPDWFELSKSTDNGVDMIPPSRIS